MRDRSGTTVLTAKGLLTALVVIVGMAVVAYTTVALSTQQQLFTTQQSTSSSAASTSSATSVPVGNQTGIQTVTVAIPPGSGNSDQISYLPQQIVVVIGVNNTVTWVNYDSAPHTVTAKGASWGSADMGTGSKYTYTFTTPGTFNYFCAYHSWMVGTVIVKA